MTRRKKLSTVIMLDGKPMNMVELAAYTGKSYYLLSDRYHSGDRDEDLIREVGAPRKRQQPRVPQKDSVAIHRLRKRQPNAERVEARRAAIERTKAAHAAAFSAPLIEHELLTRTERKEIRESVIGRQRWWGLDGVHS